MTYGVGIGQKKEVKKMTDNMTTDNMSNEEVIEVLKGIVFNGFNRTTRKERQALDLAIKSLNAKPQGKWIRKVDEVGFISHICSECGAEIEVEDCSDDKFCFNCGAKMKGGVE